MTKPNYRVPAGRKVANGIAELFLAELAAEYPDLIDPTISRAKRCGGTDAEEFMEHFREWCRRHTSLGDAPGSRARVGRLLMDRARFGQPGLVAVFPEKKALE